MTAYRAFAQKYKDQCKTVFVYIKEAHFVEYDEQGNIVDGWPIGFDTELPQHKSEEERVQRACEFKTRLSLCEHPISHTDRMGASEQREVVLPTDDHSRVKEEDQGTKTVGKDKQQQQQEDLDVFADTFDNWFELAYGAWPDQMLAFSPNGLLVFRGQLEKDGIRHGTFADQLAMFLDSF
jgi:hypothetical protein